MFGKKYRHKSRIYIYTQDLHNSKRDETRAITFPDHDQGKKELCKDPFHQYRYPVPPKIVLNETTMAQINLNDVRGLGLEYFK